MTAKEQLLDYVGEMSEEEASRLLPLADDSLLDWLETASQSVSTDDFLKMPVPVQALILRYEARFYTEKDAEFDTAEADLWEPASAEALDRIDD